MEDDQPIDLDEIDREFETIANDNVFDDDDSALLKGCNHDSDVVE